MPGWIRNYSCLESAAALSRAQHMIDRGRSHWSRSCHCGLTQPRAVFLDRRTRGLHFDLALKERAFADPDARRKDIALDLGGGPNTHRFGGVKIALYLAVDEYHAGANVALHRAIGTYGEVLGVRDRPFHAALNDQVFLRREFAAEFQGGPQH